MNFLWLLELRKYYWSLAILKKSRILQNRRKYGQIFTFSRLPNAPIFSLPNSATESFVVTDGSKEPKWKSTHHYLDAFFVFVFSIFFGQLKFGGYFVIAIKFAEVQNSKKHRGHTLDHIILIHVINSDSSEAQPSYWDRANRCDACPVLPFDCLSAQIEDFNF